MLWVSNWLMRPAWMSAVLRVVLSTRVLPSGKVTVVVTTSPARALEASWVTMGTPASEAFSAALTKVSAPVASGTVVAGAAGRVVLITRSKKPEGVRPLTGPAAVSTTTW